MNIRQIQEAREQYGIDNWGAGYFGVNDQGDVICHPTGEEHLAIEIPKVIESCQKSGLTTPLILRFPQIIDTQLERLHSSFRKAITEYEYGGNHLGVFPFKVNQRREVIDHIASNGARFDYGLEVGSKTEFVAALSYNLSDDALFICNGFKDSEFIHMGFIAAQMGKNVILVVEGPDELQMIMDMAQHFEHCPGIGLRVKLYSRGSGKWVKSSGESSKFGLSTIEVLTCLDMIEKAGFKDKLTMLHYHIGSQITEIKRIKNALKEASRVYSKVIKAGFKPQFLNIGGGVGVDYDGSKTSFQSSANYSMQEFANDVVYVIGDVCKNERVACPDIVTESGRVVVAYHSVITTDVKEVQGFSDQKSLSEIGINIDVKKSHKSLIELNYILENINRKNFVEFFHDAVEYSEELFTLFNLGYIKLQDRALGEELFQRISHRALYFSSFERHELEEFEDLQKAMVSKYMANFSIFQSTPDAWAIDQLFPIMPLSEHGTKPDMKATIVDITCDSDGCLDRFVDRKDVRTFLDLHKPNGEKPYYLGFFLVGAYQESLANEHNLFGAINEAEVIILPDGSWEITKTTTGDPIHELLSCRNYDMEEITASYRAQLDRAIQTSGLSEDAADEFLQQMKKYCVSLPYLSPSVPEIAHDHRSGSPTGVSKLSNPEKTEYLN